MATCIDSFCKFQIHCLQWHIPRNECVLTPRCSTYFTVVLANEVIIPKRSQLELGFTFSFPVLQTSINSGTLIEWTKGYNCQGMVGKDPAEFLQQALLSRNLNVNVCKCWHQSLNTLVSSTLVCIKHLRRKHADVALLSLFA